MEQCSDVLVIIGVLVLLFLVWQQCKPQSEGMLGGAYDQKVEGIRGPEDDEDDGEEGLVEDPSAFYKSEDEILSGKDESYNHQAVIPAMALEDDVKKSHDSYVEELRGRTTTASKQSLKSDFTPPVPFVGLRARVMYRQMGADKGARTVQSETPKQSLEYASYSHAPYCL